MTNKNILQSLFSALLKNKQASSTQVSENEFDVKNKDLEMRFEVINNQLLAKVTPTSKKAVTDFVSRNLPTENSYCLNLNGGGVFISDSLAPLIEKLNEHLKGKAFETVSPQAVYSSFNRKNYYLHTVHVECKGIQSFTLSKAERL